MLILTYGLNPSNEPLLLNERVSDIYDHTLAAYVNLSSDESLSGICFFLYPDLPLLSLTRFASLGSLYGTGNGDFKSDHVYIIC